MQGRLRVLLVLWPLDLEPGDLTGLQRLHPQLAIVVALLLHLLLQRRLQVQH